jgi:hypothetical protein
MPNDCIVMHEVMKYVVGPAGSSGAAKDSEL